MKATAVCLLLALGRASFPMQGFAESFLVEDGQSRVQTTVPQTPPQYPEAVRDIEPLSQPVHRTWFVDDPLPKGASPVFRDKMNNMVGNCIDAEAEGKTEGIWAGLRWSEYFGMYAVWGLVSPDSEHTDNELLGEMLNTWMDEWYPAEAGELEAGWKSWYLYGPLVEITARPKLKEIVGAERRWPNAIEKAIEIVNFAGHGDVAALTLGWVLAREYEPDFAPALFERAAFAMRMMDWHMGPNGTIRYLYNPDFEDDALFLKMQGHKLYEYAVTTVPGFLHETLQKAGLTLGDVDKMLMHQANARLNEKILRRLFRLEGVDEIPEGVMPMTISYLGNSSVATIPTLLDLIVRGELEGQTLESGDIVVFASVGAGMNINSAVYKWI